MPTWYKPRFRIQPDFKRFKCFQEIYLALPNLFRGARTASQYLAESTCLTKKLQMEQCELWRTAPGAVCTHFMC